MANGTLAASQIEMLSLSGTGIITITPPATNTNRAITLPDAAGAIVVSGTTPSLNGITFPATQSASADANTLDDYEEGTWTPSVVGLTTAGTATYVQRIGTYTKIGNTVRIYICLNWSGHTGTGTTAVTGFPFASNAGGQTPFSVFTYGETFSANNVANGGLMSTGTTSWEHFQIPTGGGNSSGIPIDAAAEIQVSGVYQTS